MKAPSSPIDKAKFSESDDHPMADNKAFVARLNHKWGLLVPEPKLAGMTTNERLFATGLLDAFDQAARKRDRGRMIEVLGKVELVDQAESIADGILADPKRYGF